VSTPELAEDNPPGDRLTGSDFVRHHAIEHIDFATIHVWPEHWLQCCSVDCLLPFLTSWLNGHIDVAGDKLAKPLLIEEFGAKMRCFLAPPSAPPYAMSPPPPLDTGRKLLAAPESSPPPELTGRLLLRNEMYTMIYSNGRDAAAAGRAFGGSLFWLLGIDGVPDSDFYTIYVPQDLTTVKLIAEHVSDMRLLDSHVTVTPVTSK
jgi:hypothetical protein